MVRLAHWSWARAILVSRMVAPCRLAPRRSASWKLAPVRLAIRRSAPRRSALVKSEPLKSRLSRLLQVRSWPWSCACRKDRPPSPLVARCSFQRTTSWRSIFSIRCSDICCQNFIRSYLPGWARGLADWRISRLWISRLGDVAISSDIAGSDCRQRRRQCQPGLMCQQRGRPACGRAGLIEVRTCRRLAVG